MLYFDNVVSNCNVCSKNNDLNKFITYKKLPPFESDKKEVMIIGHSPTVRSSSKITVTLDLNRKSNIYRYINSEILEPLGITIDICYATNLVKCLTTELPEDIKTKSQSAFMDIAFGYCKHHLIAEIEEIKPNLLITLSERVSNLMQSEFSKIQKPMKEIFGTLRKLKIGNKEYNWIPVVHLPKPKVRFHYFPEQTDKLNKLLIRI